MRIMFLPHGFNIFGRRHVLLLPIRDVVKTHQRMNTKAALWFNIFQLRSTTHLLEMFRDTARKQILKGESRVQKQHEQVGQSKHQLGSNLLPF